VKGRRSAAFAFFAILKRLYRGSRIVKPEAIDDRLAKRDAQNFLDRVGD